MDKEHLVMRWLKNWDVMAVVYSIAGSAIFALVLKWAGGFRWLRRQIRLKRGLRNYKKEIQGQCETLIVVGRRRGFKMSEVFIPLDLAPSDLMPEQKDETYAYRGARVVVGGPGAGKSTIAKKLILDSIERRGRRLPFFVRLREYGTSESIEAFISERLRSVGVPDPDMLLQAALEDDSALCVLDGLDEVRPQLKEKVCSDINKFFHRYFDSHPERTLLVTCRKEAYRSIPLDIPVIYEVRPLTDRQIQRFADKWPSGYPRGKDKSTFWRDLASTPKILELARSPLLLVGGLMQYTESNLGIPDERFQYLARVAQWLIVDWATAQGHPPDPYRPVYDRVLARMAIHLHSTNRSECPIAEAKTLVGKWLPTYGQQDVDVDDLLSNIATRTGILVSEDNANFIFAQFGLQEYFASLELVSTYSTDAIAGLTPKEWWREVVLLATAQERDPTAILDDIFAVDPLLAAAAIAECPTPSTTMQSRAVDACLAGIDAKDKAVGSAAVPLLRKVSGRLEAAFCQSLEERLTAEEEIAPIVGIALATAGTAESTAVLGKHPEIWDRCLNEAGFLSTAFENMLVEWIERGDERQSDQAAQLIAGRLSHDRFLQLIDLLPQLTVPRRDKLATILLLQLEGSSGLDLYGSRHFPPQFALWVVSKCAAYVQDRDEYLRRRESARERSHGFYDPYLESGDLVSTALFLERRGARYNADAILQSLMASLRWATCRNAMLCWVIAGAVLLFVPGSPAFLPAFIISALLLAFLGNRRQVVVPWMRRMYLGHGGNTLVVALLLMGTSVLLTLMYSLPCVTLFSAPLVQLSHLGCVVLITVLGISIRRSWNSFDFSMEEKSLSPSAPHKWVYAITPWGFVAAVALAMVAMCFVMLPVWARGILYLSAFVLEILMLWLLIHTARASRRVEKATRRARQTLSKIRRE